MRSESAGKRAEKPSLFSVCNVREPPSPYRYDEFLYDSIHKSRFSMD